jgi:hypothetical protein
VRKVSERVSVMVPRAEAEVAMVPDAINLAPRKIATQHRKKAFITY